MADELVREDKDAVDYGPGNGVDYCGICRFYRPFTLMFVGRCNRVLGKIEGNMWCKRFERANV